MSADSSTNHNPLSIKITLVKNDDEWWTACDETRGLTTQRKTRDEALAKLDDVVDTVETDTGRPPTDEELREAGIDLDDNRLSGSGDLPEILK